MTEIEFIWCLSNLKKDPYHKGCNKLFTFFPSELIENKQNPVSNLTIANVCNLGRAIYQNPKFEEERKRMNYLEWTLYDKNFNKGALSSFEIANAIRKKNMDTLKYYKENSDCVSLLMSVKILNCISDEKGQEMFWKFFYGKSVKNNDMTRNNKNDF